MVYLITKNILSCYTKNPIESNTFIIGKYSKFKHQICSNIYQSRILHGVYLLNKDLKLNISHLIYKLYLDEIYVVLSPNVIYIIIIPQFHLQC